MTLDAISPITRQRIYLDHAASGGPIDDAVVDAMAAYMRHHAASHGRGTYRSATDAASIVDQLRTRLATRLNAPSLRCIGLLPGCTVALNVAIAGLIRPGDRVITTAADHHAVLRPLMAMRNDEHSRIDVTIVPVDASGRVDANDVLAAVQGPGDWIVMTAASNVTGVVQPVDRIANGRPKGVGLICDAAQTFGWFSHDVDRGAIDAWIAPAHKACGGPMGIAAMCLHPRHFGTLRPTILGGTGSGGTASAMPSSYPEKIEAGNLNVAAAVGWNVALDRWDVADSDRLKRAATMRNRLVESIRSAGFQTPESSPTRNDLPVVAFWHSEIGAAELATIFDVEYGIELRAGHHCASAVHPYLSAPETGVVRVSAGPHTSDGTIDAFRRAVQQIGEAFSP